MRTACPRVWVISVVIKQTVMGHERGCSALAPGRSTCGSHQHYQQTDRTIMPLMEGNSGCVWWRPKVVTACCTSADTQAGVRVGTFMYICRNTHSKNELCRWAFIFMTLTGKNFSQTLGGPTEVGVLTFIVKTYSTLLCILG